MDPLERSLIEAIARDPEDLAPYHVYADWLQSRGDARGELMMLHGAGDERPGDHRITDAARAYLHDHAKAYLGPLARLLEAPDYIRLRWRCGFLGGAELRWGRPWGTAQRGLIPENVLEHLLDLATAQFLTELALEPPGTDGTFFAEVLGRLAPPTLRVLRLGADDAWSGLRDMQLGALAGVWPRVPNLRELTIHGRPASLGAIDLPALRRAYLHLEAGTADAEVIAGEVARASWPMLEHLSLWHGGSPEALRAVLARDDLVTLGEVTIGNCAFGDVACDLVVASPLAPQLHRLSFAASALGDDGAVVLLRAVRAGAFPSLATLDLSETHVSRATVEALRTVIPDVHSAGTRTGPLRTSIPAIQHDPDE